MSNGGGGGRLATTVARCVRVWWKSSSFSSAVAQWRKERATLVMLAHDAKNVNVWYGGRQRRRGQQELA